DDAAGLIEVGRAAKAKVMKGLVARHVGAAKVGHGLVGPPVPAAAAHDLVLVGRALVLAVARPARVDAEACVAAFLVGARVPVGDPLERIAGHVVEPVLRGWARADRPHAAGLGLVAGFLQAAAAAVFVGLDDGELAGRLVLAPWVGAAVGPAGGFFPLGLRGQ